MTEPTDAEIAACIDAAQIKCVHPDAETTIEIARAVLAKWATPPAVAGEPVAWLSTDSIGERYLCFTKPNDSDPARPLVFGDTAPQPTKAQAGAVPLTDEQLAEMMRETWGCASIAPRHAIGFARAIERAHGIGIKGGQHGAE